MKLDYGRYRFESVIDFIEFKIETCHTTNFQTVQRCLGKSDRGTSIYVEGLNEGTGKAATQFQFRLYDIAQWNDVQTILDRVVDSFPLIVLPAVTAVEVAFDAYSRAQIADELTDIETHLLRFHKQLPAGIKRFAGEERGSGECLTEKNAAQIRAAFASRKMTGYCGSQKYRDDGSPPDPISARFYVKETDVKNGSKAKTLPSDEHRARIEFTFQLDAVPFTTIEEARHFDFTTLSRHYKWQELKPGLSAERLHWTSLNGLVGDRKVRRVPGGQQPFSLRQYSTATQADTWLNDKSYECLRGLTRRLRA